MTSNLPRRRSPVGHPIPVRSSPTNGLYFNNNSLARNQQKHQPRLSMSAPILYRRATPEDVVQLLSVMDLALGTEDETVTKPDELGARVEHWLIRLRDPAIIFWCRDTLHFPFLSLFAYDWLAALRRRRVGSSDGHEGRRHSQYTSLPLVWSTTPSV
jgi:hypothetical protein